MIEQILNIIEKYQETIDKYKYANWQITLLLMYVILFLLFCLNVGIVQSIFYTFEQTYFISEALKQILNGILISWFGMIAFTFGDEFFKTASSNYFKSKIAAFISITILPTSLSVLLTIILPEIRVLLPQPNIQYLGVILLLGYGLIHKKVEKWKVFNELPILLLGVFLLFNPYILQILM